MKRIYFTISTLDALECLDIENDLEKKFKLHAYRGGSGKYGRIERDFYVYSQEKKRAVRKYLREEFPKALLS